MRFLIHSRRCLFQTLSVTPSSPCIPHLQHALYQTLRRNQYNRMIWVQCLSQRLRSFPCTADCSSLMAVRFHSYEEASPTFMYIYSKSFWKTAPHTDNKNNQYNLHIFLPNAANKLPKLSNLHRSRPAVMTVAVLPSVAFNATLYDECFGCDEPSSKNFARQKDVTQPDGLFIAHSVHLIREYQVKAWKNAMLRPSIT